MLLRYTLAWVPMVLIAILNGTARQLGYGNYLTELQAHQVSTIIGLLLFSAYLYVLSDFWRIESLGQAVAIGFIWLCLTLAFEFLFGHFLAGKSWAELFGEYNIASGRLWALIPLWTVSAPSISYLLRR